MISLQITNPNHPEIEYITINLDHITAVTLPIGVDTPVLRLSDGLKIDLYEYSYRQIVTELRKARCLRNQTYFEPA